MGFSLPDIAVCFVWNCCLKSCIWLCFLPCFVKQRENFHKFSNFSLKTFGLGLQMYYLCKRFQGEIELLIAKFQKQGQSLAKDFCHQKKEFFEKIYINREVVQEARHIAIYVLGRRNEPINSSNVNEGFKEWSFCFLAFLFCYFQFTFLLLNQGDSFWTDYSRYEWLIKSF